MTGLPLRGKLLVLGSVVRASVIWAVPFVAVPTSPWLFGCWVRLASAAQLLSAPRFVLLFGAGFVNPVLIPLAFLAFTGHRRGDAVRDMVADAAALRATRHPEALSRALFALRPAAPHACLLRVGLPGFLVDQYWVLSTRSQVTTSVSTPTSQRRWTRWRQRWRCEPTGSSVARAASWAPCSTCGAGSGR
jgi:hypothetical protein